MNRIRRDSENIGARLRGVKKLFDLDERFREMDRFGDYREVISLPNPPIEDIAPGEGLELARVGNDAMAESCARHPAAVSGFRGGGVADDVDGAVKEADARSRSWAPAASRSSPTSPGGRSTSRIRAGVRHDGRARPADLAASRPYRRDAGLRGGAKSRFEMWWCFGWPYETTVAMARIVSTGCSTAIRGSRSSPTISAAA